MPYVAVTAKAAVILRAGLPAAGLTRPSAG